MQKGKIFRRVSCGLATRGTLAQFPFLYFVLTCLVCWSPWETRCGESFSFSLLRRSILFSFESTISGMRYFLAAFNIPLAAFRFHTTLPHCSMAYPDDFERVPSMGEVMRKVKTYLTSVLQKDQSLLLKLWREIDKTITLKDCEIYTFVPDGTDPLSEGL